MDSIDIMLLCLSAPFALSALWVVGCLFFGRHDLVSKCLARWLGGRAMYVLTGVVITSLFNDVTDKTILNRYSEKKRKTMLCVL